MTPRICPICGRAFEPRTASHKYCSPVCLRKVKSQYNAQFAKRRSTYTPLSEQVWSCEVCGHSYTPKNIRQHTCLSAGCIRERKRRYKAAQRESTEVCVVCGKKFVRAGASQRVTCSYVCRNALGAKTQQAATVAVSGGRQLATSAPDSMDFYALQTLCPEFPSWDCPQMDPFTSRMEPAVWIDVPVVAAHRARRAA